MRPVQRNPVLVIGFNRPNLLNNLLVRLEELGITDLYVSLDGPRNSQESIVCNESLRVVKSFKEKFNMKIIYRSYNLGCSLGVVSAIDWFFSNVDFGIIIEDDCFPKDEFFNFFDEYKNNKLLLETSNVMIASAHNPFDFNFTDNSTRFILIHGWATWKTTWRQIRKDYFKINLPNFTNNFGEKKTLAEAIYWWANSTRAKMGSVDTWDGMLSERVSRLGFKTLLPEENLVTNLGYGPGATHTKNSTESNLISLQHNDLVDSNLDHLLISYYFKIRKWKMFVPIVRVVLDLKDLSKKKNFEMLLEIDRNQREIL